MSEPSGSRGPFRRVPEPIGAAMLSLDTVEVYNETIDHTLRPVRTTRGASNDPDTGAPNLNDYQTISVKCHKIYQAYRANYIRVDIYLHPLKYLSDDERKELNKRGINQSAAERKIKKNLEVNLSRFIGGPERDKRYESVSPAKLADVLKLIHGGPTLISEDGAAWTTNSNAQVEDYLINGTGVPTAEQLAAGQKLRSRHNAQKLPPEKIKTILHALKGGITSDVLDQCRINEPEIVNQLAENIWNRITTNDPCFAVVDLHALVTAVRIRAPNLFDSDVFRGAVNAALLCSDMQEFQTQLKIKLAYLQLRRTNDDYFYLYMFEELCEEFEWRRDGHGIAEARFKLVPLYFKNRGICAAEQSMRETIKLLHSETEGDFKRRYIRGHPLTNSIGDGYLWLARIVAEGGDAVCRAKASSFLDEAHRNYTKESCYHGLGNTYEAKALIAKSEGNERRASNLTTEAVEFFRAAGDLIRVDKLQINGPATRFH